MSAMIMLQIRALLIPALFVLILLTSACSKNPVQPVNDITPAEPDPFAQNQRLGRGINLGNALEAPNEGDWGVVLRSEYFDLIEQAGFNSVRIPVRWSAHTTPDPPYTIDSQFLHRVDWAIEQALSKGLAVIINIHHYEELMQDAPRQKARFLAIWEKLAENYQHHSSDLFFEIINEPHTSLTPELWNQFLNEAITIIRKTNPDRTLLVGPANWSSIWSLYELELPVTDMNIIVTVHYYNPFQFTHQGAEWVPGSNAWLGTVWSGTDAEKQTIFNDFWRAINWAKASNRPLNLGEFGAYSKADMDSRARWTTYVARTAEANDMSWHYWEFISGFGVYNSGTNDWNFPLLRALMPQSSLSAP